MQARRVSALLVRTCLLLQPMTCSAAHTNSDPVLIISRYSIDDSIAGINIPRGSVQLFQIVSL
eukprot:1767686-Pyramimonas_sp.AAC.1